jgi:hypothetical protein
MVGHKDVKAKEGVILKAGQNSKKVDFFTGKNLLQALRRQQSPFAFADDADAKKAHGSYKKLQRKIKKDQEKNESTEDQDAELIAAMRRIKKVAQREAKEIAQALFERRAYFIRCEARRKSTMPLRDVEGGCSWARDACCSVCVLLLLLLPRTAARASREHAVDVLRCRRGLESRRARRARCTPRCRWR